MLAKKTLISDIEEIKNKKMESDIIQTAIKGQRSHYINVI